MYTYMKADLYCLHCNKNTSHTILYYNKHISSIKCNECKMEIELKIDSTISKNNAIKRLLVEPFKITEELQEEFNNFLSTIPIRIINSPSKYLKNKNKS